MKGTISSSVHALSTKEQIREIKENLQTIILGTIECFRKQGNYRFCGGGSCWFLGFINSIAESSCITLSLAHLITYMYYVQCIVRIYLIR